MPYVEVKTNVKIQDHTKFLKSLNDLSVKLLKKPNSYISVSLQDDVSLLFAGTDSPAYVVHVNSLGTFDNSEYNKEISKQYSEFLQQELGATSDRGYIFMNDGGRQNSLLDIYNIVTEEADKEHDKEENKSKKKISKNRLKREARHKALYESFEKRFNAFYLQQYDDERWIELYDALKQPARHCAMINKYTDQTTISEMLESRLERLTYLDIPCYSFPNRFPQPKGDSKNIFDYYLLDAASVLATQALDLKPDDSVLDVCAAPGGKSLAILQRLSANGSLTANEPSLDRRRRLNRVISDYIPLQLQPRINVVREYLKESYLYDKVLVDVPCSAERHLLTSETEFEHWNENRSKKLAKKQFIILCDAVKSLKVNGLLVYITCSVSRLENDDLTEQFLRESWVPLELIQKEWPIGEKTKFGWIVLPDRNDGWGPIYFSIVKRVGAWKDDIKTLRS
ncbi:10451_t:CDS:2 [Ambispora gerdemannii]|uniref:NOL1/NOP2/Sun domain family member 4 n=1 Tax=Ambispora gerdemannii TaxID=144530 RepID=A0A9N8ZRZ4_9GLOM|nr:10451_t:CDS:2 [Ambispora gerdemannii]